MITLTNHILSLREALVSLATLNRNKNPENSVSLSTEGGDIKDWVLCINGVSFKVTMFDPAKWELNMEIIDNNIEEKQYTVEELVDYI